MFASINHNLLAANTARNLNGHYTKLATSTRRLSSGLRVGGAADDAAGLAIRELMRADIASFQQGARNANDAISMIQVADGSLGIIDEKLIRLKELAEQAATGTYDSTQRLMIDSEFQAMASEIDRIANSTEFNGIKLIDGSLAGEHDGSDLTSSGKMKIHFGTRNDSSEDYYYVEIGDCTMKGLGLTDKNLITEKSSSFQIDKINEGPGPAIELNDILSGTISTIWQPLNGDITNLFTQQNTWYTVPANFVYRIPAGTKNIIINASGGHFSPENIDRGNPAHNDLQLFTTNGVHLTGTRDNDYSWNFNGMNINKFIDTSTFLPFSSSVYDDSIVNSGPSVFEPTNYILKYSEYNGMVLGFSGDPDTYDDRPNDGYMQSWFDYELLTIDEAKEDLYLCFPGAGVGMMKVLWDVDTTGFYPPTDTKEEIYVDSYISVNTQEKAQKALVRINDGIVAKDKIRAHLGALQNRLENTVSNLNIQAENLQASESRISDVDVATEMTEFVRNQILTQSAVAMLSQANSLPNLALSLLQG